MTIEAPFLPTTFMVFLAALCTSERTVLVPAEGSLQRTCVTSTGRVMSTSRELYSRRVPLGFPVT